MAEIYHFSFLFTLIGLVGWFFVKHSSKLSTVLQMVFFVALSSYMFSVISAEVSMDYKLSILFRDLLIISGLAAGFSMLRNNRTAFILMILGSAVAYQMYFKAQLVQTFATPPLSEKVTIPTIDKNASEGLDQNGELLLEIAEGQNLDVLKNLVEQYNLELKPAFTMQDEAATELDDYYTVNIPKAFEGKRAEIVTALRSLTATVDYVEENETITVSPIKAEPSRRSPRDYKINDPEIDKQWSFKETGVADFYHLLRSKKIKVKKKAHIFILDTGVDGSHEDLAGNYESLKSKYDKDGIGHGTHCAGIAAAVSNNGIGVASLAMDNSFVKVTSIKVLNNYGGGTQRMIINGILEAADNGADVISMSLGGVSRDPKQKAYSDAVAYANKKGAIVVVAAGNNNGDAKFIAPANAKGVITVAAVDTLLGKASFSNYINNIERGIAAPGVNIYSTIPGNQYTAFNGTSMATPYVAGLLGIMKSLQPDLTTEAAYNILNLTGKATKDVKVTGKVIQPASAVGLLLEN
ncbi:MAG: thermitase [Flavobacteriales bacterium]|jgi:thermitase